MAIYNDPRSPDVEYFDSLACDLRMSSTSICRRPGKELCIIRVCFKILIAFCVATIASTFSFIVGRGVPCKIFFSILPRYRLWETNIVWVVLRRRIYSTMVSYCMKYKRKTQEVNPTPMQTTNNRIALRSTCPVCGTNKSRFISMKEAKEGGFLGLIKNVLDFGKKSSVVRSTRRRTS